MSTVSFIVATLGRDTLKDTLASIETMPGDEILVIRQAEPIPWDWGNSGRNLGMSKATGDYLAFIDDDDIYYPGHRQAMEQASKDNLPVLFKMRFAVTGEVIWDDPVFRFHNMGTPCIFVPNRKDKLPQWVTETRDKITGDFQFMNHLGWPRRKIIFRPEVIALVGKPDDGTRWQKRRPE